MDVSTGNTSASAEVDNDTLSQIAALRIEPDPQPVDQPEEKQAEPPKAEPTTESEESDVEAEAKRQAILREIAMDPGLTQQYVQQQAAQPAQQPQQYQPVQQEQDDPLPFDEFTYDPTNPAHQAALIAQQIKQVGAPLFEQMEQQNQYAQQQQALQQQQHYQQVEETANKKTVEFLDTYVPGFIDITDRFVKGGPEGLSAQEEALFNKAVNLESSAFALLQRQGVANPHLNVQARAQIAQHIGPELKKYAKALGLVSQPKAQVTPEQKQVMKQESYVESSNAVPVDTTGKFEKAAAKRDTLSMIAALRS